MCGLKIHSDFPCNQFGHQAPGTEEEIQEFCTLKYNTTFPLFAKIDVNGKNAEPLFEFYEVPCLTWWNCSRKICTGDQTGKD